jgi:hypothetical protein
MFTVPDAVSWLEARAWPIVILSFLLSGSFLAPAIGHAAMHVAGLRHGVELPPHEHHAPPPRHATTV